MIFYDVRNEPFNLWGVTYNNKEGLYTRMPADIAESVSDSVAHFNKQTTGGRVSFETNSQSVCVKMSYPGFNDNLPELSLSGTVGVDMYIKGEKGYEYTRTFVPKKEETSGFEIEHKFSDKKDRKIILYFPMHNYVSEFSVGIDDTAKVQSFVPYEKAAPILYYGSSITQGLCCSRTGNTYPSILSRYIDYDYINLGFSGSAKAEKEMVEYLSSIRTSLFVCDYDHNSSLEDLEYTHLRLYETFRKVQPKTPILFMTRPDYERDPENVIIRRNIIKEHYLNGRKNGDTNLYFLDGTSFYGDSYRHEKTVDGIHPNDAGFLAMANVIELKVREILSI